MKIKIFAYLFAAMFTGIVVWQLPNSIAQTEESQFSDLKLEISTTKEKYLQLEPIPISFRVSNPTNAPILGHTSFNLTSNLTNLLIKKEGGEEDIFSGFSPLAKQVGVYPRPIKPNESHEVENVLNYKLGEIFPSPGKYQVQAIFYNTLKKEKALSNIIVIEILAPEGVNKDAYNFINQSSNKSMFYTGGAVSLEKQEEIWKKFILKYDETVYGDYIDFALGEHLFYVCKYQEAEKQFQKLSDKNNFVLTDKAKKYLFEIRQKQ